MSSMNNLNICMKNEILDNDGKMERLLRYNYLKTIRRDQAEEYEYQELEKEFNWLTPEEIAYLLRP